MNNTNTMSRMNPNNNMAALSTENDINMQNSSDNTADIAISQMSETFADNNFVINVFNAVIDDIFSDQGTRFVTISYSECVRCMNNINRVTLIVASNTWINFLCYDQKHPASSRGLHNSTAKQNPFLQYNRW